MNIFNKFKIIIFLIIIIIYFIGCTTNKVISINDFLNTTIYSLNTYIGISPRMSSRDKEIEQAILHIAHQIAINKYCIVDIGVVSITTNIESINVYDSNFDYIDTNIQEIIDTVEVILMYHFDDFTFVIGLDTKYINKSNNLYSINIERPLWIQKVPQIEGYYVGVGVSEKYSIPFKSLIVADIKAAQQIAYEKNSFLYSYIYDKVEEGSTYSNRIDIGDILLAKAELIGFYIIDRWIEPDGSVYSLGIAEKK